jgi:hypothetical protein
MNTLMKIFRLNIVEALSSIVRLCRGLSYDVQEMDKLMELLDLIGIKLFVLAALKEH